MLTFRTILFPTDFSECAEHAFAQAAALAAQYDAELHVLNVVVPHHEDPDNPMNYLQDLDLSVMKQDVVGTHQHDGVRLVHDQHIGLSPAAGILEYADRHDVDLIVMGTHGRRGVGRLLMGSVAEEVVRLSTCPVLTVGAADDCKRPIHRVLAPVDFSESSQAVLTHAKELAAAFDAHLDVLHILTEVSMPGVYGIDTIQIATPEVRQRVREGLIAAIEDSPGADVPYEVHLMVGFPARDSVDFAELHQTDLVVLATHGRTGLKRLMLGSVAENIVRLAPCPVFTVKSFGTSLLAAPESTPTQLVAHAE